MFLFHFTCLFAFWFGLFCLVLSFFVLFGFVLFGLVWMVLFVRSLNSVGFGWSPLIGLPFLSGPSPTTIATELNDGTFGKLLDPKKPPQKKRWVLGFWGDFFCKMTFFRAKWAVLLVINGEL